MTKTIASPVSYLDMSTLTPLLVLKQSRWVTNLTKKVGSFRRRHHHLPILHDHRPHITCPPPTPSRRILPPPPLLVKNPHEPPLHRIPPTGREGGDKFPRHRLESAPELHPHIPCFQHHPVRPRVGGPDVEGAVDDLAEEAGEDDVGDGDGEGDGGGDGGEEDQCDAWVRDDVVPVLHGGGEDGERYELAGLQGRFRNDERLVGDGQAVGLHDMVSMIDFIIPGVTACLFSCT